jgi:hypothetical protein
MLAITVLQRFFSLILAPTPFADLFAPASSPFVAFLPALVVPLVASPLVPAIRVTAVDEDSQEALPVADIAETTHLFVPTSQPLAVPMAANQAIPAIIISAMEEDPQDDLSVSVSDEEEYDSWELSSNEDSDIRSTSSVTSDDMAEEPKGFFTFHANVSIEDIQLYPDEDDRANSDVNDCNSYENDVPAVSVCTPPSTFVASAIPRRVYVALEEEKAETSTPEPLKISPQSIDDLDEIENYNTQWLTPRALGEAKSRSRKIQRTARMRALDLAKVIPLKAHEHPEPENRCAPSVLKGLGRSSQLRKSFTMEDIEEDERQQAILERSWAEEEEDVLPDLQELNSFFKKRT